MNCCMVGARSAMNFSSKTERVPSSTTITYGGLFSENYFQLNSLEKNEKGEYYLPYDKIPLHLKGHLQNVEKRLYKYAK